MPKTRVALLALTFFSLALFSLAGCDGGEVMVDAGPPPPIVLTVRSSAYVESVPLRSGGTLAPTFGDRFYLLAITLTANSEDDVPVAPIAFTLTLDDDSDVRASASATDSTVNGCSSRSVALGTSTECDVAFEVTDPAAPPRSLNWSDGGSRSTRAPVPPPG